jgi:cation diffusion facilitator CzcD-associated flavoprotein CzcO
VPDGFRALVIGAGVSGLCTAYSFQRAGIPFTVLERRETVGGTWLENRYPGAGVDTPNHLYSFSFAPYDWSMYFALRDELHAYLEHVADRFDLRRHIRFGTTVERATYDEHAQEWVVEVRTDDGTVEELRANILVSGVGIFNPVKMPDIPGLADFAGPSFHTAQWRHDVELRGKRVAIIGSGASAMQVAPEIQHDVASLTIFQRSPQWAAPFEQFRKEVPEPLRVLLAEVPLYRAWYRARLGWTFNDRVHPTLQKDPDWPHPERSLNAVNDAHRRFYTRYIEQEVGERADLLERIVPDYPPFGKRMLMDNGWYRMLTNPAVELVTESVARIEADRVVTADGREHPADVLIIATGFDVLRFLTAYEVVGREGRTLREVWQDDDARAYLGTDRAGLPQLLLPLRTEPADRPRWQPHLLGGDAGAVPGGPAAPGVRAGRRVRGGPPGRPRRLQRRPRPGPRADGVDPSGHDHLLPEQQGPGGRQLPAPERGPLRPDRPGRPGRLRGGGLARRQRSHGRGLTGRPAAEVVAGLAHRLGHEPRPHQQGEDLAAEAEPDPGLQQRSGGDGGHEHRGHARGTPEVGHQGRHRQGGADALGEPLRRARHRALGQAEPGRDHPRDQLAQRAQGGPGEHTGDEAVGNEREQPAPAGGQVRDRQHHHASGHQPGRHLVDRIGETEERAHGATISDYFDQLCS